MFNFQFHFWEFDLEGLTRRGHKFWEIVVSSKELPGRKDNTSNISKWQSTDFFVSVLTCSTKFTIALRGTSAGLNIFSF